MTIPMLALIFLYFAFARHYMQLGLTRLDAYVDAGLAVAMIGTVVVACWLLVRVVGVLPWN